jgi:hypothetical protein
MEQVLTLADRAAWRDERLEPPHVVVRQSHRQAQLRKRTGAAGTAQLVEVELGNRPGAAQSIASLHDGG